MVWDVRKGFGVVGMLGMGVVKVLWDVRNECGLAGIECCIVDSCHLVTLGQGANSRKWRVSLLWGRGGVMFGHSNIHCTALTHA